MEHLAQSPELTASLMLALVGMAALLLRCLQAASEVAAGDVDIEIDADLLGDREAELALLPLLQSPHI